MGGVAGHMDHLYDNPKLTFSKMIEIMTAASNGELKTEEKVDGQNLFLSYSIPEGKAKGARNKGNLKAGGLDAAGLAQKFAGRGSLFQSFTEGFSAFEGAVEALSDEEKRIIFGPDTNIWYNAEIMDPGSRNVINYDGKTLKIHNVGHFIFDRDTGEQKPTGGQSLTALDNALERMQEKLSKHDYSLAREAIIRLQALEDKSALTGAKGRIKQALAVEGLSENSTIQEYTFSRLMAGIPLEGHPRVKTELVKYLLGMPDNIGKRAIKKGLPPEIAQEINMIVANKRSLLHQAILPIELAVHDFTVEILKGLKSIFIADTDKEVERLKNELAAAVRAITSQGADDPEAMEVMQKHLNKINDFSRITTPVEAVVFDYDGHTYKFAGNFAPMNQILGLFRYPKGGKKLTSENIDFDTKVVTDKKGKNVALLPGGFKPPHAGHYGLAKLLSANPDIDEVIVIIGKNPRFSEVDPQITVTAEQSKDLWDIYTRKDNNIKVQIQKGKTPVSDVYDLIADKNSFSEGDTVVLGKSDKDVGDKRYGRAQSWAEMHNPGVNVEEMVFPMIGGKNMGGTTMRNIIALGEREKFTSKLPDHLNSADEDAAWEIVSSAANESLNSFITSQIEEISSMGSGAVAGYAAGFTQKKRKSPVVKAKKPIVRRAKRRRRR